VSPMSCQTNFELVILVWNGCACSGGRGCFSGSSTTRGSEHSCHCRVHCGWFERGSRKGRMWMTRPWTGVGKTGLKCCTIPFNCVILLCASSCPLAFRRLLTGLLWVTGSHKRRDNRCAIAAVKLEQGTSVLLESPQQRFNSSIPSGLCHALESEGWEVHTDIKEHCALGSPLPETEDAGREEEFLK
jgi:hypothetical protein